MNATHPYNLNRKTHTASACFIRAWGKPAMHLYHINRKRTLRLNVSLGREARIECYKLNRKRTLRLDVSLGRKARTECYASLNPNRKRPLRLDVSLGREARWCILTTLTENARCVWIFHKYVRQESNATRPYNPNRERPLRLNVSFGGNAYHIRRQPNQ